MTGRGRNKPYPPRGEGLGAGEGTPAAIYDRHPFASFAGLDASLSPLPYLLPSLLRVIRFNEQFARRDNPKYPAAAVVDHAETNNAS